MSLKLAVLPDRKPVKLTISVSPGLFEALTDYASIYARTYNQDEPPEALAPHMLEAFLASDSGFKKARRALHANQKEKPHGDHRNI